MPFVMLFCCFKQKQIEVVLYKFAVKLSYCRTFFISSNFLYELIATFIVFTLIVSHLVFIVYYMCMDCRSMSYYVYGINLLSLI